MLKWYYRPTRIHPAWDANPTYYIAFSLWFKPGCKKLQLHAQRLSLQLQRINNVHVSVENLRHGKLQAQQLFEKWEAEGEIYTILC